MEFKWDRPLRLNSETAEFFLREKGIVVDKPYQYMWRRFAAGEWPSSRYGKGYFFVPEQVDRAIAGEVPNVAA